MLTVNVNSKGEKSASRNRTAVGRVEQVTKASFGVTF